MRVIPVLCYTGVEACTPWPFWSRCARFCKWASTDLRLAPLSSLVVVTVVFTRWPPQEPTRSPLWPCSQVWLRMGLLKADEEMLVNELNLVPRAVNQLPLPGLVWHRVYLRRSPARSTQLQVR